MYDVHARERGGGRERGEREREREREREKRERERERECVCVKNTCDVYMMPAALRQSADYVQLLATGKGKNTQLTYICTDTNTKHKDGI